MGSGDFDYSGHSGAKLGSTYEYAKFAGNSFGDEIKNLEVPENPQSLSARVTFRTGMTYCGGVVAGGIYGFGVGIKSTSHLPTIRIRKYVTTNNIFKYASKSGNVFGGLGLLYTLNEA